MAAIGAVIGLIGSAVSAIGSIQQGKAQAAIAKWNADRLREQADRERGAGHLRAELKRREGERLAGRQRALLAQSGAVTTTGTPLLLQGETAAEVEFQARLVQSTADNQARSLENRALAQEFEGEQAQRQSFFTAGATLLTGFSKFASSDAAGQAFSFG